MGKDKLRKFAENETFPNVIQPEFDEMFNVDYKLKGTWHINFWKNDKPITLELGCGKGEYSVNLAKFYPDRNFMGIDVKGARFWRGAKTAIEQNIPNVAFIRTRIEFISAFFSANEIQEIWITFPDPQLKTRRHKKRLTSSLFLNRYKAFIAPDAVIHLKTDSYELHRYTVDLLRHNGIEPIVATDDLYASPIVDEVLSIKTHYEGLFLKEGKKITYTKFTIPKDKVLVEYEANGEW
jgi:tRNA (guanine-N7-)-methyltransferase